ncbi:hypothetical protein EAH68_02500 [Corynebacterium hylobatis]|uniref:Uncharacterized protein n=1 Tax=Corynebacterium hylobatis TaxID=1859290 RepID=A0A3S0AXU6_9CORY|nr:hypothetical protein [Corynebacterium hylobatis]RSZ65636.1 hypothetical protein EAH68_02500 [Corynebacterium hylobatis]
MGKKKSAKHKNKKDKKKHQAVSAAGWKTKKKCCRSNPRCKKCPVVYTRLLKAGAFDEGGDFREQLKHARRW